jgi:hypothetical protein
MQNSAEVRWFWRDQVSRGIESWFRSGPFPPGGGVTRQDEYLLDLTQNELGIKSRGSKAGIELKGLVATIPKEIQVGAFTAHGQLWAKWTSLSLRLEGLPTVKVMKTRWLRKFHVKGTEVIEIRLNEAEMELDPTAKPPDQGCNLEFTQVTPAKQLRTWSTLGIESFGSFPSLENNLRCTIQHLLNNGCLPNLDEAQELSYPEWLIKQHQPAI